VNALDFEAQVTSRGRSDTVVSARSLDGDRKLQLRVASGATVVVLGYQGEPFLRFSPSGIEVNDRSPSAIANKLARPGSVPALDPHAAPHWSSVSHGHGYTWHDHRLGPVPGRRYGEGKVGNWSIPIVVNGHLDEIRGRLLHAQGPPLWPWLGLLFAVAAVAAGLASRSSRRLRAAAVYTGACVAGGAAVILTVSFAFVPGRSSLAAWSNAALCFGIAGAVLAIFVRRPSARPAVGGFVAVLAAFVGLSEANVFVHGFVISSLPADMVRAATGIALGAGLIAAACAVTLLLGDASGPSPTPTIRRTQVRMAVPRGRPR